MPKADNINDLDTDNINSDAIYAALKFLHSYAESEEGQAGYRAVMEDKDGKIEGMRALASEYKGVNFCAIPRFEWGPELLEEIYPGESESVELGLGVGRFMIWGTAAMWEHMARNQDAIGDAIRRFIAERAN